LYSFLSQVFRDEVGWQKVSDFFQEENMTVLASIIAQLPPEKAQLLNQCLSNLRESAGRNFNGKEKEFGSLDLRKEFAYLFLTPQGVYPFESVYLGKKKLLMDKPWEEVRAFYRSIGIEKDKSEIHLEDHIAVELGFMASFSYLSGDFLSYEGEEKIDEEEKEFLIQVQHDFLEQHLLKWAPGLCDDIMAKTRHPFYHGVAALTRWFLACDLSMLEESLTMLTVKAD
jgi:TorA maturation chaperone TorD